VVDQQKPGKLTPKERRNVAIGCVASLVLAVAGLIVLAAIGHRAEKAKTPETVQREREESARNMKRVVREERRADDGVRKLLFRETLTKSGYRCDEVTRALMRPAGTWTISCEPGHVYTFTYDSSGAFVAAMRLR